MCKPSLLLITISSSSSGILPVRAGSFDGRLSVLVMGQDLFILAMLSLAKLKRPSKDPALTGSIPEEDDEMVMSSREGLHM
jgi:hypothetical protein